MDKTLVNTLKSGSAGHEKAGKGLFGGKMLQRGRHNPGAAMEINLGLIEAALDAMEDPDTRAGTRVIESIMYRPL
jgi:hypothetical protein